MALPYEQRLPAWPSPCPGDNDYHNGLKYYIYKCQPPSGDKRYPALEIGEHDGLSSFSFDTCPDVNGNRRLCKYIGIHNGFTAWAFGCCAFASSSSSSQSQSSSSQSQSSSSQSRSSSSSSSSSSQSVNLPSQLCAVYGPSSSSGSSVSSSSSSSSRSASVSSASSASSGSLITTNCCPSGISSVLTGTFANATGGCGCLNGVSVTLTYDGTQWVGTVNLCGSGAVKILLQCTGANPGSWDVVFQIQQIGACGITTGTQTSYTCSPPLISFTGLPVINCCAGTVDFIVTA